MIWQFHCFKGEYRKLTATLRECGWMIANSFWSRDEWHITAIKKDFLLKLPQDRAERIMQKLAWPERIANGTSIDAI